MDRRDKEKIRKEFTLLTDDLIVNEKFLASLISSDCIINDHYEELMEFPERKRTGRFLLLIQRRGPKAFGHFVNALMDSGQDHLADALDAELANKWRRQRGQGDTTVSHPTQSQYPSASHSPMQDTNPPTSSGFEMSNVDYGEPAGPATSQPAEPVVHKPFEFNPTGIESSIGHDSQLILPSVQKLNRQDPWVQARLKDPEVYFMGHKPHGRVIIVNNEVFAFDVEMGDREGSSIDAVNLSQLFEQLDYKVDIWKDYDAKELLDKVKEEAKNEAHKNADAFIMFIMSHGVRGYVYGVDGEKLLISDIITEFDSTNCPSLSGKPKLFFIQACQGVEKKDDSGGDKVDGTEEMSERLSDLRLKDDDTKAPISLPEGPLHGSEMAHIHIVYSTAPGHLSWRNAELGTWFVREFVLVCNECAHKEEITDLLRIVRKRVKARLITKGRGQIAPSVDYLEKKFYFLPGI